jgi:hypothetical protein
MPQTGINEKLVIIFAVIVILVIVIISNNGMRDVHYNQIEGLWMAPDSFCSESDIDGMIVYIGPALSGGSPFAREKRKVCLIMHVNNATIVYKKLEMSLPFSILGIGSTWERKVKIKDDDDSSATEDILEEYGDANSIPLDEIMPKHINLTMNLKDGKMTWMGEPLATASRKEKKEGVVTYAELYKDNISSALGKGIANESGISSISADL